jgi:hypothetical protein
MPKNATVAHYLANARHREAAKRHKFIKLGAKRCLERHITKTQHLCARLKLMISKKRSESDEQLGR